MYRLYRMAAVWSDDHGRCIVTFRRKNKSKDTHGRGKINFGRIKTYHKPSSMSLRRLAKLAKELDKNDSRFSLELGHGWSIGGEVTISGQCVIRSSVTSAGSVTQVREMRSL